MGNVTRLLLKSGGLVRDKSNMAGIQKKSIIILLLRGRVLIAFMKHVAGRTSCPRGPHAAGRPHAACGPPFAHPCAKVIAFIILCYCSSFLPENGSFMYHMMCSIQCTAYSSTLTTAITVSRSTRRHPSIQTISCTSASLVDSLPWYARYCVIITNRSREWPKCTKLVCLTNFTFAFQKVIRGIWLKLYIVS